MITSNTSHGFKVRVIFHEFTFKDPQEYLEIGDGTIIGNETRLVCLSGTYLPSDVTSVSNTLWIKLNVPCGIETPNISITITSVNMSGNIFPTFTTTSMPSMIKLVSKYESFIQQNHQLMIS